MLVKAGSVHEECFYSFRDEEEASVATDYRCGYLEVQPPGFGSYLSSLARFPSLWHNRSLPFIASALSKYFVYFAHAHVHAHRQAHAHARSFLTALLELS
jgi:hypothetical protein